MKLSHLQFIGKKLRPIELQLFLKWLLHLKRKQIKLVDGTIYEIDPISDLGLKLAQHGIYEPVMAGKLEALLEEGDCFIDLGANEGYFTVLAGKLVTTKGQVVAFEPQERLWSVIKKNVMLNGLGNVRLLPYGAGSSAQDLMLQLYPTTNSGASTFSDSFGFKVSMGWYRKWIFGQQQARVMRLDDLLPSIPQVVKLVKVDIEGFELEALRGGRQLVAERRVRYWLIEIHEVALQQMGQSEAMIDDLMKEAGYTKEKLAANLNMYALE